MVAMTRQPLESAEQNVPPVTKRGRYIRAVEWSFTATGTGALELTTSHFGDPGAHPVVIWHIEVDTEDFSASTLVEVFLEFGAGTPWEGLSFKLDSFTGGVTGHNHIQQDTELPVPHGAYLRITTDKSAVDGIIKIGALVEWL